MKFKFGIEEMTVLQHWDIYLLALWGTFNNNIHKSVDFIYCKKFSAFSRDLYVSDEQMNMEVLCQNSSKLSQIVKTYLCWRNSGVLIQKIKPWRNGTTYYQIKLLLTKLLLAKCDICTSSSAVRGNFILLHTHHWNSVYQAMK